MSEGILDTSVIIAFDDVDPSTLPDRTIVTTITLAELAAGPAAATSADEQVSRQLRLQQIDSRYDPLPLDRDAALAFARVSASLRTAGRKASARTFDALIAAIALSRDLPVYTCNPDDFRGIDGLEVVPVPIR